MAAHTVAETLTHEHSKEHATDVNYMPPLFEAVPLGIQHVLAMFVGNVTPPLIIASAIQAPDEMKVFLIQAAMFVAGVATLVQTLGLGPIGAKVPIVMGTSFGFVPVLIPVAQQYGLPAVMGRASAAVSPWRRWASLYAMCASCFRRPAPQARRIRHDYSECGAGRRGDHYVRHDRGCRDQDAVAG